MSTKCKVANDTRIGYAVRLERRYKSTPDHGGVAAGTARDFKTNCRKCVSMQPEAKHMLGGQQMVGRTGQWRLGAAVVGSVRPCMHSLCKRLRAYWSG